MLTNQTYNTKGFWAQDKIAICKLYHKMQLCIVNPKYRELCALGNVWPILQI